MGNFSQGDDISGRRQRVREIALWDSGKRYRIRLRPRLVLGTCQGYVGRIVHTPGWVHACSTMDAKQAAYEVLTAFVGRNDSALTSTAN
jgi:hypothetical protein